MEKKIGVVGHAGLGRSSMRAAMIYSLMMQKGIKLISAEPEVIDQRGGVLTEDLLERAGKIEPDAFSGKITHVGIDLAEGNDNSGVIIVGGKPLKNMITSTYEDEHHEHIVIDRPVRLKDIEPVMGQFSLPHSKQSDRNFRREKERSKKVDKYGIKLKKKHGYK